MIPLLLIGCGNMGGALLARWSETLSNQFSPIMVVEPNAVTLPKNISQVERISDLPKDFLPAMIVLAVKPQSLEDMLPSLAAYFKTMPTLLSIAAGKTVAFYERHLGQGVGIVRAMPNTPAMIGKGMTALCQNESLTPEGRAQATLLMEAVGDVLWLESESLMDAVTALSGSGPAYIYYIIECLAAAGVQQGLPEAAAMQLALKTCTGAAALAEDRAIAVGELRRQVTSPGGTTAAALAVFQKNNALQDLISEAVVAAVARAKEL